MESRSYPGPLMLPPPPGTFVDREELIQHVGDYAVSQGYVVSIKKSKKDKYVILGCERGGVYRKRQKPVAAESSSENTRKRKTSSRLINCPFEVFGKKEDGLWVLTVRNGTHNHEALTDISVHPSARRFTEEEVLLIKEMTEAGLKPRQIMKRLRQQNPEILSTPKDVYNLKTKIRQGTLTVTNFKSLQPQKSAARNESPSATEPSGRQRYPIRVPNLIGGRFVDSQSVVAIHVINPATQQVVSQAPITTNEELRASVYAAKRAFPSWRDTPITSRQRIMFNFQELIRQDIDKLAVKITVEHGKSLRDAHDEILQGLEVVEHACGLAILHMGKFTSDISSGTDSYSVREPLGVCAAICPPDFPAFVPLWMLSLAVTCGNTYVLKPSERNPGACVMIAELAIEAGLPAGVLNIVHGTNDIIDSICDDDDIQAISFIGTNTGGASVYQRASIKGKRVQCYVGAKNYAVIMPDASKDATIGALAPACYGAGGQKCIALSTVIFVGDMQSWEEKLVEQASELKVNAGTEPGTDIGPIASKEVKHRICRLIQRSVEDGARLVIDGRDIVVQGYEHGNFIGPTILSDVADNMECYKVEVPGPVLLCMQVDSIEDAISIINKSRYSNGASIFTKSAITARKFQTEIKVRQVGINASISSSMHFSSFTSFNPSHADDLNYDGKSGIQFYTRMKTVTHQWKGFPGHA